MSRSQIVPRLMTKAEAAAYCGFSPGVFERLCEVRPMSFGDRRLERFDRFELDDWIEGRKTQATGGLKSMADAIAEF